MAATRLKDEFRKRGIPVQIDCGRITDMMPMVRQAKPDLVVATAVTNADIGVPIFDGVPLLSGIGVDTLYQDLFKCVDQIIARMEEE